jgi:hypothetical protein
VSHFPDHAYYIQITLYSAVVVGLLVWGLFSHRNEPGFWSGMSLVVLLHCIFLYLIRPVFPFTSMYSVVPFMLVEAIGGFIVVLRCLERKRPADG